MTGETSTEKQLCDQDVKKFMARVKELPTLPVIVTRIMQIAKDENSSAKDLGIMISKDQAIASRVLRLANSAFYGYSRTITSIPQAVVVLGFNTVKSLALSASVFAVLSREDSRVSFDREQFWLHAVGCAKACELLARQVRYADPETAFVAGLLHDIGKVVLDRHFHREYEQVVSIARETPRFIGEVEAEVLGFRHDAVGYWLAQSWKFPPLLQEPIRHHHQPESGEPGGTLLASMVHVGNSITRQMRIGSGGDPLVPPIDPRSRRILNLDETLLQTLAVQLKNEQPNIEEFLQTMG